MLSEKPAMPDSARPHDDRMFRSRRAPMIELTRQNKNQPEREFLENGKNREIRKIRNNKQKCTKSELHKDPAKRKGKSEKQKPRTNPRKQKQIQNKPHANPMQRGACHAV
jgi:glutamate synthase domain-containing protein 3